MRTGIDGHAGDGKARPTRTGGRRQQTTRTGARRLDCDPGKPGEWLAGFVDREIAPRSPHAAAVPFLPVGAETPDPPPGSLGRESAAPSPRMAHPSPAGTGYRSSAGTDEPGRQSLAVRASNLPERFLHENAFGEAASRTSGPSTSSRSRPSRPAGARSRSRPGGGHPSKGSDRRPFVPPPGLRPALPPLSPGFFRVILPFK